MKVNEGTLRLIVNLQQVLLPLEVLLAFPREPLQVPLQAQALLHWEQEVLLESHKHTKPKG